MDFEVKGQGRIGCLNFLATGYICPLRKALVVTDLQVFLRF